MSFLDDLKKKARGAYAQVNPFDSGRTYDTTTRGVAPGTPRQVSTPPPSQRTPQPAPRAPLPDQTFKGFTLDQGKNKTIFGMNVAWALPKNYEKVYGLKTDRDITTNKDKFVAQFDKIHPDFQKKFVTDLQDLAGKGDQGAKNSLQALQETGRFKGNFNDFAEGANERLYGGLGRGLIRATDWVLPGHNTFGLEKFADQQDPTKTGTRQFTSAGKTGEKFGTIEKGIVDVASVVVPSVAAQRGLEDTYKAKTALDALMKGKQLGLTAEQVLPLMNNANKATKVAKFVPAAANLISDLAVGTPIQAAQQKGQGDEVDWKQAVATTVAADVGLPIVAKAGSKGIQKALGWLKGGTADDVVDTITTGVKKLAPGEVAANNPAVRQVDDHIRMLNQYRDNLMSRGLKESDPALKRNADAVSAALQVKNRLIKQIAEGGYVGNGPNVPKNLFSSQQTQAYKNFDDFYKDFKPFFDDNGYTPAQAKAVFETGQNTPVMPIGSTGTRVSSSAQLEFEQAYNGGNFSKARAAADRIEDPTARQAAIDAIERSAKPSAPISSAEVSNPDVQAMIEAANKRKATAGRPSIWSDEGGFIRIPGRKSSQEAMDAALSGKKSGFAESVTRSGEISEPLRTATKEAGQTYTPVSNEAQEAAAKRFVAKGYKKATTDVMERLSTSKLGSINDQDVADAIVVLKKLDEKGGTANLQQASDLIDKLSDHLTRQGQSIQAAALLKMRTPQGLLYSAQKTLKKAGVDITPEVQKDLDSLLKEVKRNKPGSLEHELAIKTMQKYVADKIPSDLSDKVTGVWKAGLLTGIRTQTGNALSNMTFALLHDASKPVATAVDAFANLLRGGGKRTTTMTLKGRTGGYVEGLEKGYKFLKSGVDEKAALASKFDIGSEGTGFLSGVQKEINFKNPALKKYVNGVFRLMGAADRPNYYSQLRNSLYDMASAEAKNQGLRGKAAREFVQQFVEDPPTHVFQRATDEAEKAVLANDTFLSKLAGRARQAAGDIDNPLGRGLAKGGINVIAPFTKVPSAFVSRVFDFTPVGAVKEAAEQIAKKSLDQRALANAIGEATTGTALVYLGKKMAENKLISGQYPDDPKEQARWRAEGITPNSVKVGDKWYTLNYFGPIGALFNVGKNIHDTSAEGGGIGDQALQSTVGVAQTAMDQSFLQGVSGVLDAINDPKRYAENFVKNQTGSVVPTIVKDIAEATDPYQRENRDIKDTLKSRLPGFFPGPGRTDLPIKTDVFGQPLERRAGEGPVGSVHTLANPLRPSQSTTDPVINEIDSLKNNSGEDIFPTPIQGKTSFDGVDVQLTDDQKYKLQNTLGQRVKDTWAQAINSPEYQKLDNNGRVDMLLDLKRDVSAVVKREFAAENNLGQYSQDYKGKGEKLTANQLRLAKGDINYGSYAARSRTAGEGYTSTEVPDNADKSTKDFYDKWDAMTPEEKDKWFIDDPTAEYQKALAEFDRKDKAGTFTKAERIKATQSLAKDKVGSVFSKDIRDIYELSKDNIYNLITTDPNGQGIADQLTAYDKALVAAGVIDKGKFRNGFASSKGGGGSKKRGVFTPPKGEAVDPAAVYKALAGLLRNAKVG